MAMAPIPTVADFRLRTVKPETFVNIPDATIAEFLADTTDHAYTAVAKHAKGKITQWDRSMSRAIIRITARDVLVNRGVGKAGADAQVFEMAKDAEEFLDKVADGRREVFFVDESPASADDGPDGGGSENSDAWA